MASDVEAAVPAAEGEDAEPGDMAEAATTAGSCHTASVVSLFSITISCAFDPAQ